MWLTRRVNQPTGRAAQSAENGGAPYGRAETGFWSWRQEGRVPAYRPPRMYIQRDDHSAGTQSTGCPENRKQPGCFHLRPGLAKVCQSYRYHIKVADVLLEKDPGVSPRPVKDALVRLTSNKAIERIGDRRCYILILVISGCQQLLINQLSLQGHEFPNA